MSHHETMGATTESAIGNQGHRFSKSCTNDCSCGFQHFRHTGRAFGSDITDHHDISGFDFTGRNTFNQIFFSVENAGSAFKAFTFFATDLGHTSSFGEIAIQNLQVPRFFQGRF